MQPSSIAFVLFVAFSVLSPANSWLFGKKDNNQAAAVPPAGAAPVVDPATGQVLTPPKAGMTDGVRNAVADHKGLIQAGAGLAGAVGAYKLAKANNMGTGKALLASAAAGLGAAWLGGKVSDMAKNSKNKDELQKQQYAAAAQNQLPYQQNMGMQPQNAYAPPNAYAQQPYGYPQQSGYGYPQQSGYGYPQQSAMGGYGMAY